jgi:hypothetical protein
VASAQPSLLGTADVLAGAGHDTNILLQVSPDAGSHEAALAGFYARTEPTLAAALAFGRGYRLDAGYDLDFRATQGAGNLLRHQVELSFAFAKIGPVVPRLGATVGRFDTGDFAQDRFLWGSGEAALRFELGHGLRAATSYRAELRSYPDRPGGEERDLVHIAQLRLAYRPGSRFETGLGASYLDVVPVHAVTGGSAVQFGRLGPDLEMVWGRVTLLGGMWAGVLDLPMEQQWQFGADLGIICKLSGHFDASAGVDFTGTPSGDPLAQNYSRRFVGLALLAHGTWKRAAARAAEPTDLRPLVSDGQVRFRLRTAEAGAVTVVGSWDQWSTDGQPLRRSAEPGLWEVWLDLPPGSHRYRFVVDGQAVQPPDAPRYLPDDFGGRDAVVDVPARTP